MIQISDLTRLYGLLREKKPLIHMIPNGISAALCADAMAAVGARPVMAGSPMESAEITAHAGALAANLGQPSPDKESALRASLKTAAEKNIPAVLDPVGAGASRYRQNMAQSLLEIPWKGILKCNASELHTLVSGELAYEGVDSVAVPPDLGAEDFRTFPLPRNRILAVTGRQDRIRKGNECVSLFHSDCTFPNLVGTGCVAGALCACFCALTEDYFLAAVSALILTSSALEKCRSGKTGYGSSKSRFLDALETFSPSDSSDFLLRSIKKE